jgi:hypothetical protein
MKEDKISVTSQSKLHSFNFSSNVQESKGERERKKREGVNKKEGTMSFEIY